MRSKQKSHRRSHRIRARRYRPRKTVRRKSQKTMKRNNRRLIAVGSGYETKNSSDIVKNSPSPKTSIS